MKKQIAIVCTNIIVGGVEKALLSMMEAIDRERYELTLFTRDKNGPYIHQLEQYAHIWTTENEIEDAKAILVDDLKHLRIRRVLQGLRLRRALRKNQDVFQQLLLTHKIQRKIPKHFDCGIAYKLNIDDTAFLLGRIDAQKKCAWIHGMEEYRDEFRSAESLDKIFCVSEAAQTQLLKVYPRFTGKTDVIYNIVNAEQILQESKAAIEPLSPVSILTVGRLVIAKGQEVIPSVVRILLDLGHDVHWYIVGDGPLRAVIQQKAEEYGVTDYLHLLGTRKNPYPYIRNCDIYVQTSRAEGWCLTVHEARILHRPIVTTNLPVMEEQLRHGVTGSIAADTTPEALAQEIRMLLEQPARRQSYSAALAAQNTLPNQELQKLYDFIES